MASTFKLALATILALFVTQELFVHVARPQSYRLRSNPDVEGATRIRQSGNVLEPGVVLEREIAGGEVQSFGLNLTPAQFISVSVEQRGVNVIVSLTDPERKKLFEEKGSTGGQGTAEFYWVADVGGGYQIDVRTFETKVARGGYSISLKERRAATSQDRARVAAQQALSEADALAARREQKLFSEAVEKYNLALPLVRQLGDRRQELRIYTQLGDLSAGLRKYGAAGVQLKVGVHRASLSGSLTSFAPVCFPLIICAQGPQG